MIGEMAQTRRYSEQAKLVALRSAPLILFAIVIALFSLLSDRFLTVQNFLNILTQSSHVAILGIGMTFVLLIAGIDLSVGAIMFLAVAVMSIYVPDATPVTGFLTCLAVGIAFGAVNAAVITWVRIAAFIATLSALFIGRGIALYITETRMAFMNMDILSLGRLAYLGIPWAIWVFAAVFLVAFVTLRSTPFGRQLYAIGENRSAALKAGINVNAIQFAVYVISGACAGIAGFVSITQVGAASATFGLEKEFAAIAAAVLGGTSLFGGRGGVVGTVFGAVLIQTAYSGLVIINANPYIYPLVTASIIFVAVFVDSQRVRILETINRRTIRVEEA